MNLHQGDNTRAFGGNYITIYMDNPAELPVSKVVFSVGCIVKEYPNPEFPLRVNFNSKETRALNYVNTGYLTAYDKDGLPMVCEGSITFYVVNGVIYSGQC